MHDTADRAWTKWWKHGGPVQPSRCIFSAGLTVRLSIPQSSLVGETLRRHTSTARTLSVLGFAHKPWPGKRPLLSLQLILFLSQLVLWRNVEFWRQMCAYERSIMAGWHNMEPFGVLAIDWSIQYAGIPLSLDELNVAVMLLLPPLLFCRIIRTYASIVVPVVMQYDMSLPSSLWQCNNCDLFSWLDMASWASCVMHCVLDEVLVQFLSRSFLICVVMWIIVTLRYFLGLAFDFDPAYHANWHSAEFDWSSMSTFSQLLPYGFVDGRVFPLVKGVVLLRSKITEGCKVSKRSPVLVTRLVRFLCGLM